MGARFGQDNRRHYLLASIRGTANALREQNESEKDDAHDHGGYRQGVRFRMTRFFGSELHQDDG